MNNVISPDRRTINTCVSSSQHIIAEYGSTGYGCQSCSLWTEQGTYFPPCPHSRPGIQFHEIGLAAPSRVRLSILHTQTETGFLPLSATNGVIVIVIVHLSIPSTATQSVPSLYASGPSVHYRESIGTGP